MKNTARSLAVAVGVVLGLFGLHRHHKGTVLYAQSLPTTKHAVWTPNPATQNVTQYVVTVDGVTLAPIAASACSATQCSAAIALAAFGNHTVIVAAQNLALSTDPTSVQTGPASTVNFSLNQAPGATSGNNVTN